jgi:hypothetical protein
LRVAGTCAVFRVDVLEAMIFSLSLPRGIRRPCACVRSLGCGFLRPGKADPETPEDGGGAEVAASWSPTSRCHPNRRRFARHDRRLRLGGEAGVEGPDARPKPRATEGVTQAVALAIPGPGRETWPSRRPPHDDRVPPIPPISRDVASPGLCWPAATYRQSWRSTRLNGGYPVAAAIRTPWFIAPHRGAARAERYGQAQSSQRVRHLSATPWTPVYAPGRAKRQRHSVTDSIAGMRLHPAEGMPRRRRFDVGGSGLSGRWSLPVPSPAPSHRLTKYEATGAAFSTTSVRTPRWLRTNTMAGGLPPAGSAAAQFAYRPGNCVRRGRIASSRLCPPTNRD